jgi:putative Mn2+ efflux pump MntP
MDAFAVALASSAALLRVRKRQVFRLAFHFGLFQALMPLIGWAAGRSLERVIAPFDHWAAFAILAAVGAKAIFKSDSGKRGTKDASAERGKTAWIHDSSPEAASIQSQAASAASGTAAACAPPSDSAACAPPADPTRGWSLVLLSLATSIDALAVGVSFAMLRVDILAPVLVIGATACAFTVAGMILGSRLGALFGRRMEIAGGIVLIAIGAKIVAEHLIAS